jgi:hypothetical protein
MEMMTRGASVRAAVLAAFARDDFMESSSAAGAP